MVNNDRHIKHIPIDKLNFDSENPRLPARIDTNDVKSIMECMLCDTTLVELMGAIGEKGYFPGEPVLALKPEKEDDP